MIIIVSGNAGSGKSVLVEGLAKRFRLKKVFASSILQRLGQQKKIDPASIKTRKSRGFFESGRGLDFSKQRLEQFSFDKKLDKILLKMLKGKNNLIIDSRLMPWLFKKPAIKIWITASYKTRAKRTAKRDGIPVSKALKALKERNKADRIIYKKLYNIDFGKDLKPFDLALKTDDLSKQQTFKKAEEFILNLDEKRKK